MRLKIPKNLKTASLNPKFTGSNKKRVRFKITVYLFIETFKLFQACGQFEIRTFHDRVASMVNKKFHSLLADLPDTVVGRKILAGFVMSQTVKAELGEETQWMVISIGSGTGFLHSCLSISINVHQNLLCVLMNRKPSHSSS